MPTPRDTPQRVLKKRTLRHLSTLVWDYGRSPFFWRPAAKFCGRLRCGNRLGSGESGGAAGCVMVGFALFKFVAVVCRGGSRPRIGSILGALGPRPSVLGG